MKSLKRILPFSHYYFPQRLLAAHKNRIKDTMEKNGVIEDISKAIESPGYTIGSISLYYFNLRLYWIIYIAFIM